MVRIKLTLANEDIPSIRRWVDDQKEKLAGLMIASQPTRQTGDATLAFHFVNRIQGQLKGHDALVEEINRKEKAARRRK